jgi:predicted nucleic acid-binding protein
MILVDTSVWVSHLRRGDAHLEVLLNDGEVVCHPFIIGELACGHIGNRNEIVTLLNSLPSCLSVEHNEVLQFIQKNQLTGKGLGYIDVTLLASAKLTGAFIWTFDLSLKRVSGSLKINHEPR